MRAFVRTRVPRTVCKSMYSVCICTGMGSAGVGDDADRCTCTYTRTYIPSNIHSCWPHKHPYKIRVSARPRKDRPTLIHTAFIQNIPISIVSGVFIVGKSFRLLDANRELDEHLANNLDRECIRDPAFCVIAAEAEEGSDQMTRMQWIVERQRGPKLDPFCF